MCACSYRSVLPPGLVGCRHRMAFRYSVPIIIEPRSTIRSDPTVGPRVRIGIRNVPATADSVPERAGAVRTRNRLSAHLAIDRHLGAVGQRAHDGIAGAGPRTHIQV